MKKSNKVNFGLKKATFFPKTDSGYGAAIQALGAVNVSMAPSGSSNPFYAEDTNFYNTVSNTGWSGDLEVANLPDEFFTECLGWIKDKNGALVEVSDAVPREFGFAFEIMGDKAKRRNVFYSCTATRPNADAQTTEESATPKTQTVTITAVPVELDCGGTTVYTARAIFQEDTTDAQAWAAFWEKPCMPVLEAPVTDPSGE